MLTGRAAFHSISRDDSAAAVMSRIKGGEFNLSGSVWNNVSEEAKRVTQGLLTVEPTKRMRMNDLLTNTWVSLLFYLNN